jgi:hypothetical protein
MDKDLSQAKVKRKVQKEKGILFDWEFISVDELFNDLK